jgi:hypothetical protein
VFIVNYTYVVPRASSLVHNAMVHHAFDNWQISGVTSFVSGQPSGISYSTTGGADITGGGDGVRQRHRPRAIPQCVQGCDPRTRRQQWDLALSKRFPLKSERRFVQFRAEAYNAWNHTQFAGVNTSASFKPAGQQVNSLFGQVTSTRPARVLQLNLRVNF